MIRFIQPLSNPSDFAKLEEALLEHLNSECHYHFLTYTLMKLDRPQIRYLIQTHKEAEIDYVVYEEDNRFAGIVAYKRNAIFGFEVYVMVVAKHFQRKGIGKQLLEATKQAAIKEGYKQMDVLVFADNKTMLRLLLKCDYIIINIQHHMRADGMDIIKLRKYLSCE
ncbi:MAG: GNAT family N-acetyltransferase [Bacteroidales bacterium]|nr:GNAT family N-acetyltransferase [Bacteroidales bacterium]